MQIRFDQAAGGMEKNTAAEQGIKDFTLNEASGQLH